MALARLLATNVKIGPLL